MSVYFAFHSMMVDTIHDTPSPVNFQVISTPAYPTRIEKPFAKGLKL